MDQALQLDHSVNEERKIVCITGASSYIAEYLVPHLLGWGYKVRCVLCRPKAAPFRFNCVVNMLKEICKRGEKLSLFYIDDIDLCDEVMDGALRGCSFVIHIPLPFCSQSQSNVINTFIEPIVPFSLKFYQCCLREARRQFRNSLQGNVFPSMRIIYIGSAYSVHYENIQTGDTLNEETWNKHSTVAHEPMVLAKTLAEKALWEIYESEEARTVHLEVYSLLFPTILGPVNQSMAHGLDQEVFLSSNISLVRDLLANYYPSCPNLHLNIIDVRDAVSSIGK